jgi:solute carrier family 25 protein 39/40
MTARSLTPAQTTEIGVTACCREVFFMGDNIASCVAAPKPGTAMSTAASLPRFCLNVRVPIVGVG